MTISGSSWQTLQPTGERSTALVSDSDKRRRPVDAAVSADQPARAWTRRKPHSSHITRPRQL